MKRNIPAIVSPPNLALLKFDTGRLPLLGRLAGLALVAACWAGGAFAQDQKWTFVVFGDSRGTGTSDPINKPILTELARATANLSPRPAFVLVPGDLVYAGNLSFFQSWTNIMAPVYQAGIGVYPVIGNHDSSDVNAFKAVFGRDLPDNGPPGETNRTYALCYSNALVLVLDEYISAHRVNQPWVNAVLATNTRPHVFAMGHEPAFKLNHTDCLDDYPSNRNVFWTSLRDSGCRLYFAGHDHFYDHIRLDDQDGNPDNDVHQMIVGTAGAPFHSDDRYNGNNAPWTPVRLRHEAQYGYVLVELDGLNVTATWYHRIAPNSYAPGGDVFSYTVPDPRPAIVTQPVNLTNNVGTEALFSVVAQGASPLSYQWRKDGLDISGATESQLTLTNAQESDEGLYSVVVSNRFGFLASSDALLVVNQPPVADASATQPTVICANNSDAQIILNGTRSSDPDDDPLQYQWFLALNSQSSTIIARGAVAVVTLPPGAYALELVVDDGRLSATNQVMVDVITTSQAVERLLAQVGSAWPRPQPLLASLGAALASLDRGHSVSAIHQLLAFQNKVRAQVAFSDAVLARDFVEQAQEVIEVLNGESAKPAGRPRLHFGSIALQPKGQVQMHFSGQPRAIHILEASTNLVDWEMIGVATDRGEGTFSFEDPNWARFPKRFYRVVSP